MIPKKEMAYRLPLKLVGGEDGIFDIEEADGLALAACTVEGDMGNLIVTAVNNYDAMRAALEQAATELEEAANVLEGAVYHGLASIFRIAAEKKRALVENTPE